MQFFRFLSERLKELGAIGPVLQGSIASIGVRCGNPACRCARGGKHVSNVLPRKAGGKTKSVYIPSGMLEDARKWTKEFARLQAAALARVRDGGVPLQPSVGVYEKQDCELKAFCRLERKLKRHFPHNRICLLLDVP